MGTFEIYNLFQSFTKKGFCFLLLLVLFVEGMVCEEELSDETKMR